MSAGQYHQTIALDASETWGNLGFSIFPKDTLACTLEHPGISPSTFQLIDELLSVLSYRHPDRNTNKLLLLPYGHTKSNKTDPNVFLKQQKCCLGGNKPPKKTCCAVRAFAKHPAFSSLVYQPWVSSPVTAGWAHRFSIKQAPTSNLWETKAGKQFRWCKSETTLWGLQTWPHC